MTRRADLGRQRWIDAAVRAALWLLREGSCPWAPGIAIDPATVHELGMEHTDNTWDAPGSGISAAAARRVHKEWPSVSQAVAEAVAAYLASPGAAEAQAAQARREADRAAEIRAMAARAHARWDAAP